MYRRISDEKAFLAFFTKPCIHDTEIDGQVVTHKFAIYLKRYNNFPSRFTVISDYKRKLQYSIGNLNNIQIERGNASTDYIIAKPISRNLYLF